MPSLNNSLLRNLEERKGFSRFEKYIVRNPKNYKHGILHCANNPTFRFKYTKNTT